MANKKFFYLFKCLSSNPYYYLNFLSDLYSDSLHEWVCPCINEKNVNLKSKHKENNENLLSPSRFALMTCIINGSAFVHILSTCPLYERMSLISMNVVAANDNDNEDTIHEWNDQALMSNKHLESEQILSHYLAGLIEGDGYISITNKNRIILGITFNLKDKPLAEKLLSYLGKGSIVKRNTNSIELRFSANKLCVK